MFQIFAENIDQTTRDQFESAVELDCVTRAALMADAHAGYSLPIGAVVETKDIIFPSWVGYDIGCGVCAVKTTYDPADIRENAQGILDAIYALVPVGFSHRKHPMPWVLPGHTDFVQKECVQNGALDQLGTLGGGNHFIEIGVNEENAVHFIVHSGSRNVGHKVATHYMKMASPDGKAREGHYGLDLWSPQGQDYFKDMNFCLGFAQKNRKTILEFVDLCVRQFASGETEWDTLINRTHNHAEVNNGLIIHRKGATHAEAGMSGVIPGNMRDGCFIVRGKGNEKALWSSSHGAGRVMSRKQAKLNCDLDVLELDMKEHGICARIHQGVLDESPEAYKDIYQVMELQKDLVDVLCHVRPIINVKG